MIVIITFLSSDKEEHFHFTHVNDVDLYQLRYLRNINSGLGYISVKFNTHPK